MICFSMDKMRYESHLFRKQSSIENLFCSRCGYTGIKNPDYRPEDDFMNKERHIGVIETAYVEKTEPFFNRGLGCITNGTRHAEKIAKQKGLIPVGDAKASDLIPKQKDTLTPILNDGLRELKRIGRK